MFVFWCPYSVFSYFCICFFFFFFFSSRRRHTRWPRDWSSDVCSSDLGRSRQTGCCGLRDRISRKTRHVPAGDVPKMDFHCILWRRKKQIKPDRKPEPSHLRLALAAKRRTTRALKIGRASCRERGKEQR